jgi:chaperonin GroEL
VPFLEYSNQQQRPLILITDMDFTVEAIIQRNRLENKMPVAVVKPPYNGSKRRDCLRDIALLCGTQMITLESGSYFDANFMGYLGSCKDVTISKRDMIITPNDSQKETILGAIAELKEQYNASDIRLERKYLKERISRLSGGVSIIKVGAYTESELKELTDRVDDAICAVRSAKEEGIVAGGGVTLLHASNELELDDVTSKAVKEPFNQILRNAGYDNPEANYPKQYPFGIDVKEYTKVDMFESGIVDCVKVLKNALSNAISTATTILMVDHVITYERADRTK